MKYERLSDEAIHLQQELTNGMHDPLCRELAKIKDWEDRVAHIATHCDVVVDGLTTIMELNRLYTILTDRLITRRENGAGIIVVRAIQ